MTVRFTIARDGSVKDVSSTSAMSSAEVARCVERSFRALQFPQPEGNGVVVVSYPIVFSPGS